MQISTDFTRVRKVIDGLERNYEKYGAPCCPCKMLHNLDNICPCKEVREGGDCICGLFN